VAPRPSAALGRTTDRRVRRLRQCGDELLAQLHQADNDRAGKWETVLLVGTPATVAAARSWHHTIWHLKDLACPDSCDPDEWINAVERSRDARSHFYEAARGDLVSRPVTLDPMTWRHCAAACSTTRDDTPP
jgi:hypothetical protein